jgi:hypothetical protein
MINFDSATVKVLDWDDYRDYNLRRYAEEAELELVIVKDEEGYTPWLAGGEVVPYALNHIPRPTVEEAVRVGEEEFRAPVSRGPFFK